MKALILHANQWLVRVESPSDRIAGCQPEELHDDDTGEGPPRPTHVLAVERMEECLVVLFHIESHDTEKQVKSLCKDVAKIARKVGTSRLMISGFAHLSHSRPDPIVAKDLFLQVVSTCKTWIEYEVQSSHFGYNKSLVLDVKGHPDAFKHRSY